MFCPLEDPQEKYKQISDVVIKKGLQSTYSKPYATIYNGIKYYTYICNLSRGSTFILSISSDGTDQIFMVYQHDFDGHGHCMNLTNEIFSSGFAWVIKSDLDKFVSVNHGRNFHINFPKKNQNVVYYWNYNNKQFEMIKPKICDVSSVNKLLSQISNEGADNVCNVSDIIVKEDVVHIMCQKINHAIASNDFFCTKVLNGHLLFGIQLSCMNYGALRVGIYFVVDNEDSLPKNLSCEKEVVELSNLLLEDKSKMINVINSLLEENKKIKLDHYIKKDADQLLKELMNGPNKP